MTPFGVAGIKLEWWPRSNRNGGRDQIGMPGRDALESAPIDGDGIKRQAQAGEMGEQMFAVVLKRRVETTTKAGKRGREKWVRAYRAPQDQDNNKSYVEGLLAEKIEEWAAFDCLPSEAIGELSNYDRGHRMYGMQRWTDMFSPRQLFGHGTSVEVYREILSEKEASGELSDVMRAAFVYLAICLDKMIDYNSRMTRWHSIREVMVNTFNSHNFAHRWSFAEMAPLFDGAGRDWGLCCKLLSRPHEDVDWHVVWTVRPF